MCLMMTVTVAAWAEGDGYEGVLAPSQPAESKSGAASPGYEGVIAPADGSGAAASLPLTPKNPAPEMTIPPDRRPFPPPKTTDDLKFLSIIHTQDRDQDSVNDALVKPRKVESIGQKTRIEGKLPLEYAIEKSIERILASVKDEKASREERQKRAKEGYEQLKFMTEGLRFQKTLPEATFQQMGLSEDFIREEKEGLDSVLPILEKALIYLKNYKG